jgi:hypothetical protein
MKRGLVVREHADAADAVFGRRLDALRRAARAVDAPLVLVYADVSRSNGIDFLTNFCLYWNEAVLAVPVEGPPALVTKLSKRVQPWIRKTSVLEDVRSGPRLAGNLAAFVEERCGPRAPRIALADLDAWPNALLADLEAALPRAELVDLPNAVKNLRLVPDVEEAALLHTAATRLDAALAAAWSSGGGVAERSEIAVRDARLAGFLDVDVDAGSLGDGTEYIDVIGQYGYVWVRLCRAGRGAAARWLGDALAGVVGEIRAGVSENDLAASVRRRIGGPYRHAFSCLSHAEIESRGDFRRPEDLDRPFQDGEIVCPVLTVYEAGGTARVADTVIVGLDGAESRAGGGAGGFDVDRRPKV